ncbi:MAG TPA: hypothetical protein VNM90_04510 [Haliangium sp.]|nr:hypothetical protein [Haliangium sp.]
MIAVGYGTLMAALFSLMFNPMTLISLLTVVQGGFALRSLLRGDWYRKRLGAHYYVILLCTIVGTLIGAIPYFLILLALVLSI